MTQLTIKFRKCIQLAKGMKNALEERGIYYRKKCSGCTKNWHLIQISSMKNV